MSQPDAEERGLFPTVSYPQAAEEYSTPELTEALLRLIEHHQKVTENFYSGLDELRRRVLRTRWAYKTPTADILLVLTEATPQPEFLLLRAPHHASELPPSAGWPSHSGEGTAEGDPGKALAEPMPHPESKSPPLQSTSGTSSSAPLRYAPLTAVLLFVITQAAAGSALWALSVFVDFVRTGLVPSPHPYLYLLVGIGGAFLTAAGVRALADVLKPPYTAPKTE